MSEPALEGPTTGKREILLLIGVPRTRVNKGERKAEASRGDPRHIMDSDFA
jgi:hypothetical protein